MSGKYPLNPPAWLPDETATPWEVIYATPFGYVVFARRQMWEHDKVGGVEFGVTEHTGTTIDPGPVREMYEVDTHDEHPTPFTAPLVCKGHVKWDGCSHLNFLQSEGYAHVCGGEAWRDLLDALEAARAYCEKHIPDFIRGEDP